ncbi:uncharacterized protein LOC120417669 [Culex pipiens pallens]|uniref:uncharacterized protein LOC120417669 n=1 Tax=Culex pipiens pallens TaxID=42434 RepID=UPI001952B3D7|nr:uncharacterized protein LOC120417669 [Culex pipiens pallens]
MEVVSRLWNRFRWRVTAYYRTLSRDFDYSTDFFFGLDFLLAVVGARLKSGHSGKVRRWWTVYRWAIYLPVLVAFRNTVLNIYRRERLEIILSCLQVVIACAVTFLRMFIVLRHYGPLMRVRRYLNRREFGRILGSSLGIRSRAFYHIRRIVIPSVAIMCCVFTSILALDISQHHYLKLPFQIDLHFLQKFCEKLVYFVGFGVAMMIVLVYLVIYTVVTGLTAEVEVIALTFAAIFDNVEVEISRPKAESNFCKFAQIEFNKCVQIHAEFLAVLDQVRPLLNVSFLIVYYSTALNLASGAIYLSQMKSVTMFSLQTLYYCVWAALECCSLTRMVSLLTEASESISREVYNLNWPEKLEWDDQFQEEYRAVRNTMATVMTVAQQALRLNCFGFFEFTQDRFYELLNMAYSLFAFFNDFV